MAKVTWLVGGASKNVDAWIAHRPEVKAILRAEAYAGAARARATLLAHKPGTDGRVGPSRISTTKGSRLDWFVNLDDPVGIGPFGGQDGGAAGAIELETNALGSAF